MAVIDPTWHRPTADQAEALALWEAQPIKVSLPKLRSLLFDWYGPTCGICGGEIEARQRPLHHPGSAEVDHVTPKALGGPHAYGNVRLAHRACNEYRNSLRSGEVQPEVAAQRLVVDIRWFETIDVQAANAEDIEAIAAGWKRRLERLREQLPAAQGHRERRLLEDGLLLADRYFPRAERKARTLWNRVNALSIEQNGEPYDRRRKVPRPVHFELPPVPPGFFADGITWRSGHDWRAIESTLVNAKQWLRDGETEGKPERTLNLRRAEVQRLQSIVDSLGTPTLNESSLTSAPRPQPPWATLSI
jgi:hypothetical protein